MVGGRLCVCVWVWMYGWKRERGRHSIDVYVHVCVCVPPLLIAFTHSLSHAQRILNTRKKNEKWSGMSNGSASLLNFVLVSPWGGQRRRTRRKGKGGGEKGGEFFVYSYFLVLSTSFYFVSPRHKPLLNDAAPLSDAAPLLKPLL